RTAPSSLATPRDDPAVPSASGTVSPPGPGERRPELGPLPRAHSRLHARSASAGHRAYWSRTTPRAVSFVMTRSSVVAIRRTSRSNDQRCRQRQTSAAKGAREPERHRSSKAVSEKRKGPVEQPGHRRQEAVDQRVDAPQKGLTIPRAPTWIFDRANVEAVPE